MSTGWNELDLFNLLPDNVRVAFFNRDSIKLESKFGNNKDIDTATVPEDLWNGGGLYTGHNAVAAETVEVFSSDANDTSAGTGARTIRIIGLDADYNEQSETVTLNGLTAVDTVNTYIRLQRALVLTAGTGGANAGTITARQKTTTANVFFVMPIGQNQTHAGAFTIPAGYTGYITQALFDINRAGTGGGAFDRSADVDIYCRPFGGVYNSKFPVSITTGNGIVKYLEAPIIVTEKTDIVLRCGSVSADNTDVSGRVDYYLIQNVPNM